MTTVLLIFALFSILSSIRASDVYGMLEVARSMAAYPHVIAKARCVSEQIGFPLNRFEEALSVFGGDRVIDDDLMTDEEIFSSIYVDQESQTLNIISSGTIQPAWFLSLQYSYSEDLFRATIAYREKLVELKCPCENAELMEVTRRTQPPN